MDIEEHVKEELNRYLGCNQPEINSVPLNDGSATVKTFTFPY